MNEPAKPAAFVNYATTPPSLIKSASFCACILVFDFKTLLGKYLRIKSAAKNTSVARTSGGLGLCAGPGETDDQPTLQETSGPGGAIN